MIDSSGEITNQVEHDFSDDAHNFIHTKLTYENQGDNYIIDNGLELSENIEYGFESVGEDLPEVMDETEDDQYDYEEFSQSQDSGSYKQCPDNLTACLAVCQPILKIRLLAFTLCERECMERCGSASV